MTRFHRPTVFAVLTTCLAFLDAGATRAAAQPIVQGVVFGGLGSTFGSNVLHVGGGAEVLAPQGFGVSTEIGYLTIADRFADGGGVLGVGGFYYVPVTAKSRARPFVVGGYGGAFREGYLSLWNVGGGLDYRLRENHAVRLEFRDYFDADEGEVHGIWTLRVGLVFR